MSARIRSNRPARALRAARQSRGFTERRRRRGLIGGISVVVALAAWIFVLSRLSYISALEITHVDIYGEPDLSSAMQAAAMASIDGSYAGLFSRANSLIYPREAIARAVASTSPRIDNVAISRNGLHGLSISVSEKAPEAVICADLPDLGDQASMPLGKECYLADADAYLYRHAEDDASAARLMRFYMPDLPDTGILGVQATSTAAFKRLEDLVRSVATAGVNVQAMLVRGDGDYELYADNPSGSSMVVIQMNESAGLATERDNLLAFWNKMVLDARAAGKPVAWSEIKLQYPPNVYSRPIDGRAADEKRPK